MCYCRLLHKDGYIVFSFWSLKSKANSWFPRKRYYRTNSKQLLPKVWCFLQTARVPWSHNTVGSHQVSLLCIYTVVTRGIALIQGMPLSHSQGITSLWLNQNENKSKKFKKLIALKGKKPLHWWKYENGHTLKHAYNYNFYSRLKWNCNPVRCWHYSCAAWYQSCYFLKLPTCSSIFSTYTNSYVKENQWSSSGFRLTTYVLEPVCH